MSPPSEWAGGPIKSYERNLFLTFWHQMDRWYRDIGLFRGERKRRESEWLSAWSGGSPVIPGVKHKYATGLHIHHVIVWHISLSNMLDGQRHPGNIRHFSCKKYNCSCLLFNFICFPASWRRDDFWMAAERTGLGSDRDHFLRTRWGRHQTASPFTHITSDIEHPVTRSGNIARCWLSWPLSSHLITGAAWQARAPLASQSRSVKMSQNMASWYTFFSHFPFTLIPPFTQHVILLRKHLFSPLPPMPLLLAFLSFSLRLSEFSAWWRSSELTAGAAHPGLTRNGQWLGKCIRASTKKPNVEKCSKAAQTSGACDLFYLCGRYSVVLSTQAIT